MYSILIKTSDKKYAYHLNSDGTVFTGNAEAVQERIHKLINTYPINNLVVVHNVKLTPSFEIEDVSELPSED
ncbi:MAG: hypothetical protein HDQ88_03645 [Clostridia bacterium]|nr:hypothetical protein [Clostridia bacterium]